MVSHDETDPIRRQRNATTRKRAARAKRNRLSKPGEKAQLRMREYLVHRSAGKTVDEACAEVGVSINARKQWRKNDPAFKAHDDRVTVKLKEGYTPPPCPFTPLFREKYFAIDYEQPINPRHIRVIIDFINRIGPGEFGLITLPPESGKSALAEDWLCQGFADDPETRAVIISKSQPEAIKRLLKIQTRMEDIDFYGAYIEDFGPFVPTSRQKPWAATKMTIERKTPRQRDYSIQGLGVRGAIQGTRLDRAMLDDIADDQNQSPDEVEAMSTYIRQSVNTRLGRSGRGLAIGTRQDENDIYKKLTEEGFFDHVLALPAEFEHDFSYTMADGEVIDWKAGDFLWPDRYTPGEYNKMKAKAGPRIWDLVYQQKDAQSEGQKFPLSLIESCYRSDVFAQTVPAGWVSVVGVDPSSVGYNAALCVAVNKQTGIRRPIDLFNEKGLVGDGGDQIDGFVQYVLAFCTQYRARMCVIENNSTFALVVSNPKLRVGLTKIGCELRKATSIQLGLRSEKMDYEDLAIEQLSTVFANQVYEIPTGAQSKKILWPWILQLLAWRPGNKKIVRDLVKAFQLAELGVRQVLDGYSDEDLPTHSSEALPGYLADQQVIIRA